MLILGVFQFVYVCVCERVHGRFQSLVFWAFPSVTATAGGPSWYILLCVCVCVVIGCGSGDFAGNTCWGTTVATSIPGKIRQLNGIVQTIFSSLLCQSHCDFKPFLLSFL